MEESGTDLIEVLSVMDCLTVLLIVTLGTDMLLASLQGPAGVLPVTPVQAPRAGEQPELCARLRPAGRWCLEPGIL